VTTHLSARLTWHQDAWNGRICRRPTLNAACMLHEHVRAFRNDQTEEGYRAQPIGAVRAITGYLPPCQRDANAFGEERFVIRHDDPLEGRDGQKCLACAQAGYRVIVAMAEAEADLTIAESDATDQWEHVKDRMLGVLCYWQAQCRQLDAQCFYSEDVIGEATQEKKRLFPDAPPYVDRIPQSDDLPELSG
jgi:hypothetical protein